MKKKYTAVLASALALALMLTGCAGDKGNTSGSADGSSSVSSGVTSSAVSSGESSSASSSGVTSADASHQAEEERPMNRLLFANGAFFPGMSMERNDDFEDGTYWYEDQTEDGWVTVVNRCVPMDPDWMALDLDPVDVVERVVHDVVNPDAYDFWGEGAGEQTTVKSGYPTFYGQWYFGRNEDTQRYDGVIVFTDYYAYIYYLSTPGDHYSEVEDTFRDILQRLQLDEAKE